MHVLPSHADVSEAEPGNSRSDVACDIKVIDCERYECVCMFAGCPDAWLQRKVALLWFYL